jgi:hypothetical protein
MDESRVSGLALRGSRGVASGRGSGLKSPEVVRIASDKNTFFHYSTSIRIYVKITSVAKHYRTTWLVIQMLSKTFRRNEVQNDCMLVNNASETAYRFQRLQFLL